MNQTETEIKESARTKLPDNKLIVPIISAMAVLCSVSFAYAGKISEYISLAAAVAVLVFMAMTVRRVSLFVTAFLPTVLLFITTDSVWLSAIYVCFMFTVVAGGLVIAYRSVPAIAAVPVIAYLISFAITKNPVHALISLAPFPAAVAMGYSFRKELSSVPRICRISGATVVTLVAGAVIYIIYKYGYISMSLIEDIFNGIRQNATDILTARINEMLNSIYGSAAGDTSSIMSEIAATANGILNYVPAVIIIFCNVMAFLADRSGIAVCVSTAKLQDRIKPGFTLFRMSVVSAAVFIVAYLTALFCGGYSEIVSVAAGNIALVLEPGLAMIGIATFAARLFGSRRTGIFTVLMIAAVFVCMTNIMLAVAAFFGAYVIIHNAIIEKMLKDNDENGGNQGDG